MSEFLTRDASDADLLEATAAHHVDWMARLARGSAGQIFEERGVRWTHVVRSRSEVSVAVAGSHGADLRGHLEEVLDFSRARRVDRVGYWAFSQDDEGRLGSWLSARGFRWGRRPHWMALDLSAMADLPSREELAGATGMALTSEFSPRPGSELPCYDPDTAHVRQAMAAERPQRVWHAIIRLEKEPVGQVSICATTGRLGVCGLHDAIVVADKRVKGIGAARLKWVCRFALDLGCRYLVLNAALGNETLFGLWGFRSLGFGRTWWLPGEALDQPVPQRLIEFAEAIGLGDLDALAAAAADLPADALDAPLPNRMTPLQLAGATGSADAAEWLICRGASLGVLAAWDLGWRDRARELLARRPELLNGRRPNSGKSLLHVAVERDDAELAEMLLSAGADLGIKDNRFGGTALDWAHVLGRPRLAGTIRRHMSMRDE